MRIQGSPAIATWLLKLFCSSAEDDSLIGDLLEQYQQGRGRSWYWRQVIAILFLRLYRKGRQLSLSGAAARTRQVFTLLIVIAAFSAVLLSDVWVIFLFGVFGGIIVGILMFLFGNTDGGARSGARIFADEPASKHPGISINHIPVEGAVGLIVAIGTVFIFAAGVTEIREIFVLTAPLGVLAFVILRYWHKHHSVKIQTIDLHKE